MRQAPIAIFISDLHLSLTAPIWRSEEPNWFEAMERPLKEIRDLQEEYDIPVFCAGDIFHVYYCTPELINFALEALPERLYAIPGNHDLPDHNLNELRRSAFWTLVQSHKITCLAEYETADYYMNLVPYGQAIKPPPDRVQDKTRILLTHRYVWIDGFNYKGATEESRASNQKDVFSYDISVFGDNHTPFTIRNKSHLLWNCGTIIRRRKDEGTYKPCIGLLTGRPEAGLTIEPYFLSTEQDKHLENVDQTVETDNIDLSLFIRELEKLGDTNFDFTAAVKKYIQEHKPKKSIQDILYKVIKETV